MKELLGEGYPHPAVFIWLLVDGPEQLNHSDEDDNDDVVDDNDVDEDSGELGCAEDGGDDET